MIVIDDYLDLARDKQGFSSDRELCRSLGLAQNAVNYYRTKRSFPSDDTMRKLVEFCYPDSTEDQIFERQYLGLMQLNQWRTEGTTRAIYKRITERLAATIVLIPLVITLTYPSNVRETETEQTQTPIQNRAEKIYIMRQTGLGSGH